MNEELIEALSGLMEARFSGLTKPLRKNLVVSTFAFILVLSAVRSGQGRLSLAALARVLPTQGTAHAREKRLHRFLKNPRLDFRTVTGSLAAILLPPGKRFCPVILDQTKSGSAQAMVAAVPYAGRVLPLACYTFAYPLTEPAIKSQNQLEHIFLLDTETSLPPGVIAIWIADRAYARSRLLQQSEQEQRPYIVRGRKETIITHQGRRMKLGQLHAPPRKALRYQDVFYHAHRKVPVDVIVYYDPTYQEPWYLLVPVAYRKLLETDLVVDLYRERMQIEQSFRDFKTHLGLRGLNLQIDIAPRMGRLLLAFCLTYILCVLLGDSSLGQQARTTFELPRHTPRHGTRRTLSALSIAMLILSHPAWVQRAIALLLKVIWKASAQRPLLSRTQLYLPQGRGP
jgi:hypothetical protein